jgi:ribose transport system permease protein
MANNSIVAEVGSTETSRPASDSPPARRDWGSVLGRYSGLCVLVLIIAVFAAWIPGTFLSATTLKSILGGQSITLVLALGLLFSLAAGQYDLSCAQNLGLSAVVCAKLTVDAHMAWPLAALIAIVIGGVVGALNGAVVGLGVDSFIATLGMSSVLLAFSEELAGGVFIGPVPNSFQSAVTTNLWDVPLVAIYALALAFVLWYALEHTPGGRRTYAAGANPDAARLAGVRTSRYVFWSLVISGVVSAFAGVLVAAKVGEISGTVGPPYLLPSVAACLLGATQFKVGRFNVWGTVLAVMLLATGITGVELVGAPLWITDLFNGVVLIGAVSMAVVARKRSGGRGARSKSANPNPTRTGRASNRGKGQ